jgi:hypothetical protein
VVKRAEVLWVRVTEDRWKVQTPKMWLFVTHTPIGDYRAEYWFGFGCYQIGYYHTLEEAQKQCQNKAFDRPVTVGARQVP